MAVLCLQLHYTGILHFSVKINCYMWFSFLWFALSSEDGELHILKKRLKVKDRIL